MNVYLDASVLVKSYIAEAGSSEVSQLMTLADWLATSLLSRVEVPAASAKAVRVGWVERDKATAALHVFRVQWPDFMCVQATEGADGTGRYTGLGAWLARLRCRASRLSGNMAGSTR